MHNFRNLLDLFNEYLAAERGVAHATLNAYNSDLRKLSVYMEASGLSFTELTVRILQDFFAQHKLQSSSLARHLSTYKRFYGFLVSEGVIKENPIVEMKTASVEGNSPVALNYSELSCLLKFVAQDSTPKGIRMLAMLELMYSTGLRVSEMLSLKVNDVFNDGKVMHAATVTGKGGSERVVIINDSARLALGKYYALINKRIVWLFPGGKGIVRRPFTRQGFFDLCKKAARDAGISNFSPHVLRHSFATHLIRSGLDIRIAQELLGHKSINSTQIYTKLTANELLDMVQNKHPIAKNDQCTD